MSKILFFGACFMHLIGILGIAVFIGISFLFSKDRKAVNWRTVAWGLGLQVLFALSILGNSVVSVIASAVFLGLIAVYLALQRFIPFTRGDYYPTLPKAFSGLERFKKMPTVALVAVSMLKFYVLPIVLGFFLARFTPTIVNIIWGLLVALLIAKKFFKLNFLNHMPIGSALFMFAVNMGYGGGLATAIATNGAEGTVTHGIQQMSTAVGNFLSIPSHAGASMLFGALAEIQEPWYFIFVIQVLPTVIFFSAFISVLYYLGIVQILVAEMAQFMQWSMKTSGAETLSCSSNIFVGQTEAPILVKPYINSMTKSEIHAIMTGGFATISGGLFAGFVAMGIDPSYLISASVMSAPAALMLSKIIYPECETPVTLDNTEIPDDQLSNNIIDAAAKGTNDGLFLALNIGANLLAFIALVKLIDMGLGVINPNLSLNMIFGYIFQYVALIIGVSWNDIQAVGTLIGNKVAINEFVAYANLSEFIKAGTLSPRSQAIAAVNVKFRSFK